MSRIRSGDDLNNLPQDTPVVVTTAYEAFSEGQIIYRDKNSALDDDISCQFSEFPSGRGDRHLMNMYEVELAKPSVSPTLEVVQEEPLGVFRPVLETRKVGKVRVELVDDGFPLALRELAKVMTWAQTAKGYDDHDWQNLPNAEVALAAAASRHRTDHIKQRVVDGVAATECVDPESKIAHKAHELFGVMAQLELLLRGEFDKPKAE